MFGRRRHAAAAVAPIVAAAPAAPQLPRLAEEQILPRLAEEQIFELVHTRIAAAIGGRGEWVVRRRTSDDTDELFHSVLAHQVAVDVTTALRSAQLQLEAGEQPTVVTRDGDIALAPAESTPVAPSAARFGTPDEASDSTGRSYSAALDDSVAGQVEHSPAHRHDETQEPADAELDEDVIALRWEPAPITVWTDLKKPVTGPLAVQLAAREPEPQHS